MCTKRVQLIYQPSTVDQPIIYNLIKHFDITINIIQARVLPEEEGKLVMDMRASDSQQLFNGIEYLKGEGIEVKILEQSIIYKQENCTYCGACTGLCRAAALTLDQDSWELIVNHEKCLLCGMCLTACAFDALTMGANGN